MSRIGSFKDIIFVSKLYFKTLFRKVKIYDLFLQIIYKLFSVLICHKH